MDIISYVRLGSLHLGTPRKKVCARLGPQFTRFVKWAEHSAVPTDAYDSLGLHLYYDKQDHLEFIEANPPCVVTFRGVALLGEPVSTVLARLAAQDIQPTGDVAGPDFRQHGFNLYVPEETVESVGVYRRAYYEPT